MASVSEKTSDMTEWTGAEEGDPDLAVSINLIEEGLYLGNLASACSHDTLKKLNITHVLSIDTVPLPRTAFQNSHINFKYIKAADVPKQDLIIHFPETNEFIRQGQKEGCVLVHCYFGVSRSAAVVIAYIMTKHNLGYEDALILVKSRRPCVHPNSGFVAQLKLFAQMECQLDKMDPRYRQFRLKLAGNKFREVKILPQIFADLVKPDPGLIREHPDPLVYRCKKCRRIVASLSNIIPHIPKQLRIEMARKGSKTNGSQTVSAPPNTCEMTCAQKGQILLEKLKSLTCKSTTLKASDIPVPISGYLMEDDHQHTSTGRPQTGSGHQRMGHGYQQMGSGLQRLGSEQEIYLETPQDEGISNECFAGPIVDTFIAARSDLPEVCKQIYFVEPMVWMKDIQHKMQGKLNCPKCDNKIGSFSWTMGCECPCGQKVAPAFYLVPSKVEWSNVVQNVQVTV